MAGPLGYEILGAVKVKDGLFIGDEQAAQDLEFVVANKVTHVINCCGRQVPCHWESIGVVYITYYWVDTDNQIILDNRDVVAGEIYDFIEETVENAESVLIHSVRGQSRSCCVLSAYLMRKYGWGLRKTMEFLSSRRPDLNLKPAFLQQLSGYERRLMQQGKQKLSLDWDDTQFSNLESEELLLRNTYINSQMGPLADWPVNNNDFQSQHQQGNNGRNNNNSSRLVWQDNFSDDKSQLEKAPGPDQKGKRVVKGVLKKSKSSNNSNDREPAEQQNSQGPDTMARPSSATNENRRESPNSGEQQVPPQSSSHSFVGGGSGGAAMEAWSRGGEQQQGTTGTGAQGAGVSKPMNAWPEPDEAGGSMSQQAEQQQQQQQQNQVSPGSAASGTGSDATGEMWARSFTGGIRGQTFRGGPRDSFDLTASAYAARNADRNDDGGFSQQDRQSRDGGSYHHDQDGQGLGSGPLLPNASSSFQRQKPGGVGGPGISFRDSMGGGQQHWRESTPEPPRGPDQRGNAGGPRSYRREPSPKGGPGGQNNNSLRGEPSQPVRGESPLRRLSRTSQSPGPKTSQGYNDSQGQIFYDGGQRRQDGRNQMPTGPGSGGIGNFNFGGLGGASMRQPNYGSSGGPGSFGTGMMQQPAGPGAGPRGSTGSGGMGAFRSGGPVRARADMGGAMGAAGSAPPQGGNNSFRMNRPATAPSQRGPQSRPASPLGGLPGGRNSTSSSRPASPNSRPPSPSRAPGPPQYSNFSHLNRPGAATMPTAAKQRSLSSHMRRAPSPTPQFNRNSIPGKARWRM